MNFRAITFGSAEFLAERALRQAVLRAPLGLHFDDKELAAEREQLHFGLFDHAGRLRACVIAVPLEPGQAKIRQMAVHSDHRGSGCGRELMRRLEAELARRGFCEVSMHARATALGFYEKLGYAPTGPEFLEVGLPHFRMEKRLPAPGPTL